MNQRVQNSKCLLLNADYTPLRIISWKRAILWSVRYNNCSNFGIEILEYYTNKFIQGVGDKKYPVPAVAKTVQYFNLYQKTHINFSRHNLFIRDNHMCQYCGIQLPPSQLTYDHIIPKSRFNHNRKISTNWTNVVTSCRNCNHKKGNRTPVEAGMSLIKLPIAPKYSTEYLPWYKDLITIDENDENFHIWGPFIKSNKNYADQCGNI
jgi:hypothetical protein